MSNKFYPCLWFDQQAEEAANFYVSIFKNSRIVSVTHYDKASAEAAHMPEGTVLTVMFELEGQKFMALNGGPVFKFTEAISVMVDCQTQAELDEYWNKLTAGGGQEVACGWLKDKYGLSWQIVPAAINEMFQSKDPKKIERMMKAMLQMVKLDIETLKRAFEGKD